MLYNYYKITNIKNGKFYIGITQFSSEKRINRHFSNLRNGKHPNYKLQKDWDDYGQDYFIWETLETLDYEDVEEAYEHERFLIEKYQAQKNGYNLANGGHLNPMYNQDIKKRMVQTKQNQADNVYQLEEIEENVFQIVAIYPSQKSIQRIKGWSQANIWHAIHDKTKSYGYFWILESQLENFEQEWRPSRIKITPTAQLDEDGNIVKVHHNMVTFCDEYGWPKDAIRGAINRGGKARGIKFIRISIEEYYKIKPITLIK